MPAPPVSDHELQRTLDILQQVGSINRTAKRLNIERSTVRDRLVAAERRGILPKSTKPDRRLSQLTATAAELRKSKIYVVTSAQNNTELHPPFWGALLHYCRVRSAQMLVIPAHYRNPDAFHQEADADYSWPAEVLPYLLDRDLALSDTLAIMGDAKINATAENPLAGFDALSGVRSAIYGHAQVQMRMVATPHAALPKMLHTTGSVSKKNYSRSKAGKKAAFHHTLGALVLEVSGSRFWVRELQCDDKGGFYDLDAYYTAASVSTGHRAPAVVLGDEHVKFVDPAVRAATFGCGGLVETLRPEVLVRHDIHDHYSQSHHHEQDTILKITKARAGDWQVRDELELTRQHLVDTTPLDCQSWVVESNHHDHLYRWICRVDENRDPHNGIFAWKLKGYIADAIERGHDPDPFKLFLRHTLPPDVLARVRFVGANDSALIAGIDVSQHGDKGANGARPSPAGFARSVHKMFTGHSHTPGIHQGCWTVGTSTTRMDYAKGLSSWMVTHGIIYPNGKRALVNIVAGDWRLPEKNGGKKA